jgi:hypothetical protein
MVSGEMALDPTQQTGMVQCRPGRGGDGHAMQNTHKLLQLVWQLLSRRRRNGSCSCGRSTRRGRVGVRPV